MLYKKGFLAAKTSLRTPLYKKNLNIRLKCILHFNILSIGLDEASLVIDQTSEN